MPRPRINGGGRSSRTYSRIAVDYAHKKEVLDYLTQGHNLDETIDRFYGELLHKPRRAKKKADQQTATIHTACSSGRGTHRNLRRRGDATVLPRKVEEGIVRWINALRRDGAPVSRLMLRMHAKDLAADHGIDTTKFSATDTWIKLFLRRHKLALRTRTRQGQTTPADAKEAVEAFREEVLRTMVEKSCVKLFNADQTAISLSTYLGNL
ncbi:hypothetical protein DVH05_003087 [Phytophthora capsici]|nr:hypothetical protein DVH05_003087 [Phytophthora capsici]